MLMNGSRIQPTICAAPSAVTTAWLQSVLRHAGHDCELASFEAANVGTGQVGQNVRFRLTYSRGTGPATIVGKFASDDPESRQTGISLMNYFREVRFYQELGPTLDIQTPRMLFTEIEPESHDFVLMMEDLAPAEQGDQIRGCGPEEAMLAIRELTRLHGPRWDDPTLKDYDWLGGQDDDGSAMIKGLWDAVFPGFLARYTDHLSPEHLELTRALNDKFGAYVAKRPGPKTVTHGDYRLDNMMFGDGAETPRLVVLDWQLPFRANGLWDVVYFLGGNFPPEWRREHEEHLLRVYHDALVENGLSAYSFDRCMDDYRACGLVLVGYLVTGAKDIDPSSFNERGQTLFETMFNRYSTAIMDLESWRYLP